MKEHYIAVEVDEKDYKNKDYLEALKATHEILFGLTDYIEQEFNTTKFKAMLTAATLIGSVKDQVEEDSSTKLTVRGIIEDLPNDAS